MVGAWPRLAAVAALVLLAAFPLAVRAAGPIVPDSSCADESTYKSLKGDAPAALEVFNKSPETVKVWWLDYSGKRVLYQVLPPFTDYVQRTWLTHPWVITSASGACYRFLVMNSQEQSVTVEPELGPGETVAPLATSQSTEIAPAPTVTAPPASGPAVQPTPGSSGAGSAVSTQGAGPGTTIAIAGVAAAVVALIAFLVITGRLPGLPRGQRS